MNGKFLCCSDLHIRSNAPINRKDDYFETAIGKFSQIVSLANKHKADIICAGDIFDHIKVGHKVVNTIISILGNLDGVFYLVLGQHDAPNHKTDFIDQSPIQTLLFQNNVVRLTEYPIKIDNCLIYGASWGERIPRLRNTKNRMLVLHKSITPEKPPFFLTEAISAKEALSKYTYDFIISGDYHVPFVQGLKEKILINPGPMLRQKINESELQPSVFLLDTLTKQSKRIYLKVRPAEDVFILENATKKTTSEFKEELDDLVQALKDRSERPNYKQVVDVLIKEMTPDKRTVDKIKEKLYEAEHGK